MQNTRVNAHVCAIMQNVCSITLFPMESVKDVKDMFEILKQRGWTREKIIEEIGTILAEECREECEGGPSQLQDDQQQVTQLLVMF